MTTLIRASSLGELFDCPARWASKHIEGRRCPTSAAAQLGRAIHASTAVFDQSTLDGSGITADEAAGAAVDAIHRPDEDIEWEDSSPSEAEGIAVAVHRKYCLEIAPKQNYKAVEILCNSLEISDLDITLTGTTDRIIETDDGLGIADIKTGKTAVAADGTVKTAGAAFQLGVYELLAEAAAGVPITAPAQVVGMNIAKTDKGQRIAISAPVVGAREVLLGEDGVPGILETASQIIKAGMFFGNPRSMLCNVKYCPSFNICNYRR